MKNCIFFVKFLILKHRNKIHSKSHGTVCFLFVFEKVRLKVLGAMKQGRGTCSTFKVFNLTLLRVLHAGMVNLFYQICLANLFSLKNYRPCLDLNLVPPRYQANIQPIELSWLGFIIQSLFWCKTYFFVFTKAFSLSLFSWRPFSFQPDKYNTSTIH